MVFFREKSANSTKPRLKRLQQAQAEIYRQVQLLLPDDIAQSDCFRSQVAGSPDLMLEIRERHAYTHFLRLTYAFGTGAQTRLSPDAHLRVYHDVRMAEVTAFNTEQGFKRTAHPWYPVRPLMERSWRENMALDKWLGYLLQQGHSFETMRTDGTKLTKESPSESSVEVA